MSWVEYRRSTDYWEIELEHRFGNGDGTKNRPNATEPTIRDTSADDAVEVLRRSSTIQVCCYGVSHTELAMIECQL